MSRSFWAWAETRRRGGLVHGAAERRRLDGRLCLERRLLPGAVSASKYTVILLVAGILVLAAEPARALAASARGVEQTHPSRPAPPANSVVLVFGSGHGGGSSAAHVRAVQRRLNSVGYSPGPIDGRYGPRTERAVELFQSAHGLRVDGVAGPITLTALRTPTTVFFPGAGYSGPGSGAVRGLQRRLRRDGYSPGAVDGRYGPLTTRAVRRFQAAHGLRVDGVAGPQTFRALKVVATRRRTVTRATARPRPKPSSPPTPRRTILPRSSHPGTPRATRSTRSSWMVVLLLTGLVGLATLAGGTWLVGRRRRGLNTSERSPGAGTATAAAAGSGRPDVQAESNGAAGLEQLADPERPADAEHALELGFRLAERGDVARAERAYRYADERGDAIGACNLGVLLEHRGDLAGAEAAYGRADARGSADGAFNLAALLVERGDTEAAIAAYRRADRRGDAAAAVNLGVLLEQVGDFAGAAHAYSRAAERGHAQGAFRLGVLLERGNDPQGALQAYERAQASEQPEVAEMARARVLGLSRSDGEER